METATPPISTPTTTSNKGWAPLKIGIALILISLQFVYAQSPLQGSTWRVLHQSEISWDATEIQLQREDPKQPAPQVKGNFAFSNIVFQTDKIAMVYTAGYIGDSMAKSSQGYWLADAQYFQLSPSTNVIYIDTDGCPAYTYRLEGDKLYLNRHTPQTNKLIFQPQATEFQDAQFYERTIQDVAHHFDCKQFDELLVTIKTNVTEFNRSQAAQIPQLQEDRATLLKAMLYSNCNIQPDQLQVLSQLTYTDEPTVTFEFHKSMPWMENDSLRFEIVPTMSASNASARGAHHARIALTDKQKEQLNAWSYDDWHKKLNAPTSDFATCILLYAITLQDIPVWYKKGAHEWKQFGKAQDLEKWEKYLTKQVPTINY